LTKGSNARMLIVKATTASQAEAVLT
jgi:hypothetical protein